MFKGWISLRVEEPKKIADWYTKFTELKAVGGRPDIGSVALGTEDGKLSIILLRGEALASPEKLQMHFPVEDVDAEYERLKGLGLEFKEAPEDKPWGWRHAYTQDPVGHTIEICSPLPGTTTLG